MHPVLMPSPSWDLHLGAASTGLLWFASPGCEGFFIYFKS